MSHTCHSMGCERQVPPKMFMCREHWFELPKSDRDTVWNLYIPGQEIHKNPSREYIEATHDIIRRQAIRLGLVDTTLDDI